MACQEDDGGRPVFSLALTAEAIESAVKK